MGNGYKGGDCMINIDEIIKIVEDCEEFKDSGVSRYAKEQEERLAYQKIAEIVKGAKYES